MAAAHNNLGNALRLAGCTGEALAHYQRASAIDPNLGQVYTNLGNALSDQGRVAEAETAYRRAVELRPERGRGGHREHCNLLSHLNYCWYRTPAEIYQEH